MQNALLVVLVIGAIIFIAGCTNSGSINYETNRSTNENPVVEVDVTNISQNETNTSTVSAKQKRVVIDSYNTNSVTVRNIRDIEMSTRNVSVFIDSSKIICDWSADTFPPYTVRRCSFAGAQCQGGQVLRVEAAGGFDEIKC